MSSGTFTITRYELNSGSIQPIRLQPETLALTNGTEANDPPAGATTNSQFVRARKGTREYGVGARGITISWDGNPPANYADENLRIPVLTPTAFDAYGVGDSVTYLGTAATVVSKQEESVR